MTAKKVTITLTIPLLFSEEFLETLRVTPLYTTGSERFPQDADEFDFLLEKLIKQTIAEYVAHRRDVDLYMKERYPDGFLGDHKYDAGKVRQIEAYVKLAELLGSAVATLDVKELNDD